MGIYVGLAPSFAFINIEDEKDFGQQRYDKTIAVPVVLGYQQKCCDKILLGLEGGLGGSFFVLGSKLLQSDNFSQAHLGALVGYKIAKCYSLSIVGGVSFQSVRIDEYILPEDGENGGKNGGKLAVSSDKKTLAPISRQALLEDEKSFWLINPYLGFKINRKLNRCWSIFGSVKYGFGITDQQHVYFNNTKNPIGKLAPGAAIPENESVKPKVFKPNYSLWRGVVGLTYEIGG